MRWRRGGSSRASCLVAYLVLVSAGDACVAVVPPPVAYVPCDTSYANACGEGFECGEYSVPIEAAGQPVSPCVPEGCLGGALCAPGCRCGCEGCSADEACDVRHSESDRRDEGKACVPRGCFDEEMLDFLCGDVTRDGVLLHCLPCAGI